MFQIFSQEVLWSIWGSHQTLWIPLCQMLHDILGHYHIQWHLHWSDISLNRDPVTELELNTIFYVITIFHGSFATGAASQQRTLTPPDTWWFPIWDLHLFYTSRGSPRGVWLKCYYSCIIACFSDVGLPSLFVTALSNISCFCQVECIILASLLVFPMLGCRHFLFRL